MHSAGFRVMSLEPIYVNFVVSDVPNTNTFNIVVKGEISRSGDNINYGGVLLTPLRVESVCPLDTTVLWGGQALTASKLEAEESGISMNTILTSDTRWNIRYPMVQTLRLYGYTAVLTQGRLDTPKSPQRQWPYAGGGYLS